MVPTYNKKPHWRAVELPSSSISYINLLNRVLEIQNKIDLVTEDIR